MKAVRRLSGRAARLRDGRFVAEGPQAVREALGSPLAEAVYLTQEAHARHPELGELALVKLQGAFERSSQVTFVPGPGGQAVPVEGGTVRTGEVETGNAGAVDTTIAMIGAQRNYDASMQAIQTYRQMDQRANELGRTR